MACQAEVSAKAGRASGWRALYSGLGDRRICLNTYARRNRIPCWNRTSLCGFAGRRLNCSAIGMCSDFDYKGWVETRVRFSWITAWICDETRPTEGEIGTMMNVTVNPQCCAAFRNEWFEV